MVFLYCYFIIYNKHSKNSVSLIYVFIKSTNHSIVEKQNKKRDIYKSIGIKRHKIKNNKQKVSV